MFYWTLHLTGELEKNARYVAVAVEHKVYYFGDNYYNTAKMDVDVFNTVSLCWRKFPLVTTERDLHLEYPYKHSCGHTSVLLEYIIYIWGGYKHSRRDPCNVLYAFDVDSHRWFKPRVSGTVPKGRYNHSACVLGKVMYIHGGCTELTGTTNDMYKLDTTTMVWSVINTRGTLPPASSSHSATIIGTKMFVFGGLGSGLYNTMIRVFDTETNCWLNTHASAQLLPGGSFGHSAFTYNGELYIFGGTSLEIFNGLWKFNPESFSWKKVEPKGKGPSEIYSLHPCCVVGDRILLFEEDSDDLFILDFSPSLRTLCKLAVIQHGLEQAGLTHNVRWELAAMTTNSKI